MRGSVGALWLTPQTLELAPGNVREHLISASLRACYAVADSTVLRLDACSGAFIGAVHAEARGFAQNTQHSELFLAFPAGLGLATADRWAAHTECFDRAPALIAVHAHQPRSAVSACSNVVAMMTWVAAFGWPHVQASLAGGMNAMTATLWSPAVARVLCTVVR